MADKKASARCADFAISLTLFSILLFLMRLYYISANSGSLIPPTLFQWHFAILSLSFPGKSALYFTTSPFGHIFLSSLWRAVAVIPCWL